MDGRADAEGAKTVPQSHRLPGPASAKIPPKTFLRTVWDNPREVLLTACLTFAALALGTHLITEGSTPALRLLGLPIVAGGLLFIISYVLTFLPGVLAGEGWKQTRTRQVARVVVKYAWAVTITAVITAGLAWKLVGQN